MRNYFRLIIGVLLMMGGCSFTTDYFSDSKQEELNTKIEHYEQLTTNAVETMAVLDSVYKETTVKILGAPIKTYETNYFFMVNDTRYSGVHNPSEPPSVPVVTVKYLASDPSINSVDPQRQLDILKEQKTSKSSLYIGIFLLAVGGVMIYSNFNEIRQRKRAEELATQQSIDEFNKNKGL